MNSRWNDWASVNQQLDEQMKAIEEKQQLDKLKQIEQAIQKFESAQKAVENQKKIQDAFGNFYKQAYAGSIAKELTNLYGLDDFLKQEPKVPKIKHCECGAEKLNLPGHATKCPVYKEW